MSPKVHSYLFTEKLDKVDKSTLLAAGCLILLGVSGFTFFKIDHSSSVIGEQIAVLSSVENNVKRKSISSLIWSDITEDQVLYYGDEILTSDQSSTAITFTDQTRLEVPENSLVRLTRSGDSIEINLIRGSFKLINLETETKATRPTQNYRLREQSGQVAPILSNHHYLKENSKISSLPIAADQRAQAQAQAQAQTQTSGDIGSAVFNNLEFSFEQNQVIELTNQSSLRAFKELPNRAIDLEVTQPDGKVIYYSGIDHHTIPVPISGDYKIRYRFTPSDNTENQQQQWSETKYVSIQHQLDYKIPTNLKEQTIADNHRQKANFNVDIEVSDQALEYVIYKDHQWDEPYKIIAFTDKTLEVGLEEKGRYYWKLRRKDDILKPLTQTQVSQLAKIEVNTPIAHLTKIENANIRLSEAQNYRLPLKAAQGYQNEEVILEVYKKDQLDKPVLSQRKRFENGELSVNLPQQQGEYFWRVLPTNTAEFIAPTPLTKIQINEMPIPPQRPLLPEKLILNYVKIRGVDSYRIELPRQKNAVKYYLEVFEDPEMQKRVYRQLQDGNIFIWRTTRSGHYYYRFQFTDEWGRQSPISLRGDLFFPISPFVDF